MRLKPSKNIGFDIFEYLIIISLILHCRTIWSYMPGIRGVFTYVNIASLVFGVIGCIIFSPRVLKKKLSVALTYSMMLGVFVFIFCLFTQYNLDGLLKFYVICTFSLVYAYCCLNVKEDIMRFFTKFYTAILLLAVISLFFWLFGSRLSILHPNISVYSAWGSRNVSGYYYLYYEPQTAYSLINGDSVIRNCGIFTEAPMYSFLLCLGWGGYTFICNGKNKIIKFIFIISILSTICSTGYIILLLVIMLKIVAFKPRKLWQRLLKLLSFGVILFLLAAVWIVFTNKLNTISGNTRVDDFIAGFYSWKDNWVFGNGLENVANIQKHMSEFRSSNTGFSNSIMQLLSDGGIFMFFLYLTCFCRGIGNSLKNRDTSVLCFECIYLLLFIMTLVTYTNMVLFINTILFSKKVYSNEAIQGGTKI